MSTGSAELDAAIGGLIDGDNVVWVAERDDRHLHVERSFLAEALRRGRTAVYVATGHDVVDLAVPDGVDLVDATATSALAPAALLADELDRRISERRGVCVVIEDLGALARRWGPSDAAAFFARTCPSMLHAGTVTYWRVPRRTGSTFVDGLRAITQWLFEVRNDQLHVVKAESAAGAVQGLTFAFRLEADQLVVRRHPSAGRLARGLSAVRRDLGLTQAQLATVADVTASAISQAESGARGLSVDTLITISDRLGISLDRLVDAAPDPGYRLARHDRSRTVGADGVFALADDPRVGLRAHLIVIGGHASAAPPFDHDGIELVAVVRGLVQVGVGEDAPVLRPGDTLLITSAHVRSWRNLRPDPAALLWVLRDQ